MNKMDKFKFYVQKVFPAVYDDALSYYELLSKLIAHVNDMVDSQNFLSSDFKKLYGEFEKLYEYITTLDLQEEVNHKIDSLIDNGVLENIIDVLLLENMKARTKNLYVDVTFYGADPSGINDSAVALQSAHAFANEHGLPVHYPKGNYLIASPVTIVIKTDTDFRGSTIKIDESVDYGNHIFQVESAYKWVDSGITLANTPVSQDSSYLAGLEGAPQNKIFKMMSHPSDSFITPNVVPNITETFVHIQNGKIIGNIIKTTSQVDHLFMRDIDTPITIKNLKLLFFNPNINVEYKIFNITRDNVSFEKIIVDRVFAENGYRKEIFHVSECFNTVINNLVAYNPQMTVKPYEWDNVSFEGYLIRMTSATNILLQDVHVTTRHKIETSSDFYGSWGSSGGTFYKNLTIRDSDFSRVDSHAVINGLLVENSYIDWVQTIGSGKMRFNNVTFTSSKQFKMIGFYAATPYACQWAGDIEVIDCTFKPTGNVQYNNRLVLVDPSNYDNSNQLTTYMPFFSLVIRNLTIDLKDYSNRNNIAIDIVNLPFNREGQNAFVPRNILVDGIKYKNSVPVVTPTICKRQSPTAVNVEPHTNIKIKDVEFIGKFQGGENITLTETLIAINLFVYGQGDLNLTFEGCTFPAFVLTGRTENLKVLFERCTIKTIHLTYSGVANECPVRINNSTIRLESLSNQYIVQTIPNESWKKLLFTNTYFYPYQLNTDGTESLNTLFVSGLIDESMRYRLCYTDDLLYSESDRPSYNNHALRLLGNVGL